VTAGGARLGEKKMGRDRVVFDGITSADEGPATRGGGKEKGVFNGRSGDGGARCKPRGVQCQSSKAERIAEEPNFGLMTESLLETCKGGIAD